MACRGRSRPEPPNPPSRYLLGGQRQVVAVNPDPRRADLYAHVVRGEMWSPPEEKPEIPTVWIRDLLVTGDADGKPVHAKGVQIRGAVLNGHLDLQDAALKVPLRFDNIDT